MSRPPGTSAEFYHNSATIAPSANSFSQNTYGIGQRTYRYTNVGQNTYGNMAQNTNGNTGQNGDQNYNVVQNIYDSGAQRENPASLGNQWNYLRYRYHDNKILYGATSTLSQKCFNFVKRKI